MPQESVSILVNKNQNKDQNVLKQLINQQQKNHDLQLSLLQPQQKFQDLILSETNKIKNFYLDQIIQTEFQKFLLNDRGSFLKGHKITQKARTYMVDWMIEVLYSFECRQHTFFTAIEIMDIFLKKTIKYYTNEYIHIIGVCSLLIASKLEDIAPLNVSICSQKLSSGKFNNKNIIEMEQEIITTLNYKLYKIPSLLSLLECMIVDLNILYSSVYTMLKKVVLYVAKIIMHDYKILQSQQLHYLAASTIYIALKVIVKYNYEIDVRLYTDQIQVNFNLQSKQFKQCVQKVQTLANNFQLIHSQAKNLIKYDSFSLNKNTNIKQIINNNKLLNQQSIPEKNRSN